jgi:hypothetical protein
MGKQVCEHDANGRLRVAQLRFGIQNLGYSTGLAQDNRPSFFLPTIASLDSAQSMLSHVLSPAVKTTISRCRKRNPTIHSTQIIAIKAVYTPNNPPAMPKSNAILL